MDERLSRIAITRSVDAELAVGVTLHMHLALSERGKTAPHLATSRSIAALFAQPSFPDGTGIVRPVVAVGSCGEQQPRRECRLGDNGVASSQRRELLL